MQSQPKEALQPRSEELADVAAAPYQSRTASGNEGLGNTIRSTAVPSGHPLGYPSSSKKTGRPPLCLFPIKRLRRLMLALGKSVLQALKVEGILCGRPGAQVLASEAG